MLKMKETELQRAIIDMLEWRGYYVQRLNAGSFYDKGGRWIGKGAKKGTADVLAIGKDGIAIWIEVKVKPNKPSAEQISFLKAMKERGCRSGVAYSVEEALDIAKGEQHGKSTM